MGRARGSVKGRFGEIREVPCIDSLQGRCEYQVRQVEERAWSIEQSSLQLACDYENARHEP